MEKEKIEEINFEEIKPDEHKATAEEIADIKFASDYAKKNRPRFAKDIFKQQLENNPVMTQEMIDGMASKINHGELHVGDRRLLYILMQTPVRQTTAEAIRKKDVIETVKNVDEDMKNSKMTFESVSDKYLDDSENIFKQMKFMKYNKLGNMDVPVYLKVIDNNLNEEN